MLFKIFWQKKKTITVSVSETEKEVKEEFCEEICEEEREKGEHLKKWSLLG